MQYITHPHIHTTRHGFFTRNGGVSDGVYTTANMSYACKDCPKNIAKNHQRVKDTLHLQYLITLHQIHGDVVHTVTPENIHTFKNQAIQGDGLVCGTPDIGLGVLTADCVPILFTDPYNKVVGACHAGWGGARQGVMYRTVDAMLAMGATLSTITAIIGPSIAQSSYEVDIQFKHNFCQYNPDYEKFFTPWSDLNTPVLRTNTPAYGFDLTGFIMDGLRAYGIDTNPVKNGDTYTQPDTFFSYRRATHRAESDYGRQISVISI